MPGCGDELSLVNDTFATRNRFYGGQVGLSGEVYETPCHQQPVFRGYPAGRLHQAERICAEHICLPISAKMTAEEAEYVVDSLERALELTQTAPAAVGD